MDIAALAVLFTPTEAQQLSINSVSAQSHSTFFDTEKWSSIVKANHITFILSLQTISEPSELSLPYTLRYLRDLFTIITPFASSLFLLSNLLKQYASIHALRSRVTSFRVTAEQICVLPCTPLPFLTTYGPLELLRKLSVASSLTSLRYLVLRSLSRRDNPPALLSDLRELAHLAPNLEILTVRSEDVTKEHLGTIFAFGHLRILHMAIQCLSDLGALPDGYSYDVILRALCSSTHRNPGTGSHVHRTGEKGRFSKSECFSTKDKLEQMYPTLRQFSVTCCGGDYVDWIRDVQSQKVSCGHHKAFAPVTGCEDRKNLFWWSMRVS
ncbi:hypothetical protein PILCRDRAFT_2205 [Piloderma croceum F 1598]|uniref:Uncharacterized protein n=1 Tax=Piloderma croceum (strain F 1598) TaxID=765440 RepID=A0A0C3CJM6_PILCF|nr:hypothetical protein PILCRDRAFT_2205 [Piloderma croceum F 1598]